MRRGNHLCCLLSERELREALAILGLLKRWLLVLKMLRLVGWPKSILEHAVLWPLQIVLRNLLLDHLWNIKVKLRLLN